MGTGGTGTWNTSTQNNQLRWREGTDAGTLTAWSNTNNADDTAVFGGTAGTVTLGSDITVNSLRFLTKDYLIQNPWYRSYTFTLAGSAGAVPTITVETGAATDSVTISSVLAGTNGLTKAGSGTLTLSGNNTYTGATTVSAGTLNVNGTMSSSAYTIGGATNGATLTLGANDRLDDASAVTVNSGGTFSIGNYTDMVGTVKLTGGSITGGTTGLLTGSSYDMQSGTVSAGLGGSNGLTKNSAGTVILSGANTYTGVTKIDAGVLSARSAGALGGSSSTTVTNGATLELSGGVTLANTGTLELNGNGGGLGALRSVNGNNTWQGNLSLGSDATIYSGTANSTLFINSEYVAARTVTLGANTLTVDGSGNTWFNANLGVVGDKGGLVKNGTGTLTLYGYVTRYTGETKVNAGVLELVVGPFTPGYYGINGPLTIGKGSADSADAGTVAVRIWGSSEPRGSSYENQISPNSAVTINSDGILNVGKSTTMGSLTLNGGQVRIADGQTVSPSGAITANTNSAHQTSLITGGSLALANAGTTVSVARDTTRGSDLTITSQVTGTGGLTKSGAGILTLGAANTYTGATTISGGTLAVNGSLASGSAVTVGTAGTLAGTGTVNGTVAVRGELAPGAFALDGTASIGTLTTGSQTWYDGASYAWQVNNTLGAAGTAYDTLVINGGLNLSNLSTDGFTLEVLGLSGSLAGAIANFDGTWSPTQYKSYTWTLLTASGGITGFEAGDFQIDLTNFSNVFDQDHGNFFVGIASNNSLTLTYESVPEPATYAALLGVATLGFVGVRRWRQKRPAKA